MILRSVAVVVAGLMVALRSLAAAHPIYQPRLRFRLRLQSDSRWPAHRPLPAALRPRLQYPARLQRRERPAHASILADCPMKSIFFRPLLARATPHGGASPHPSNAIPCPGPSSPRPGNSSSVSARWPRRSCAAGFARSKPSRQSAGLGDESRSRSRRLQTGSFGRSPPTPIRTRRPTTPKREQRRPRCHRPTTRPADRK